MALSPSQTPKSNRKSYSPQFKTNSKVAVPSVFLFPEMNSDKENQDAETSPRSRKKGSVRVQFAPSISVVLIPSIDDYEEAGLHHLLWYNSSELRLMEKKGIVSMSLGRYSEDAEANLI
jgi:hypothetical protein